MPSSKMKECRFCGEEILAVAKKCRYCGEYLDGRKRSSGQEAGMLERMIVPVGRPASAIAAGYLALPGIIPVFGLPFSIGAIVCGLIALKAIKQDPELSGAGRAWFGIILGGLMTLFGVFILVMLAIGPPGR